MCERVSEGESTTRSCIVACESEGCCVHDLRMAAMEGQGEAGFFSRSKDKKAKKEKKQKKEKKEKKPDDSSGSASSEEDIVVVENSAELGLGAAPPVAEPNPPDDDDEEEEWGSDDEEEWATMMPPSETDTGCLRMLAIVNGRKGFSPYGASGSLGLSWSHEGKLELSQTSFDCAVSSVLSHAPV